MKVAKGSDFWLNFLSVNGQILFCKLQFFLSELYSHDASDRMDCVFIPSFREKTFVEIDEIDLTGGSGQGGV